MDFMNQYNIREIFITVWNFWAKYNGKSVHLRSNLPAQDSKRNKKKHSQQSLTCFFRAHLFKCHSFLLALFVSPLSITCSGNPECQLLKFSVTLPDVIKRLWRAPQCIATSRLSGLEQGELNRKQWVQDALWERLRGLHDYQGRTCFVHTVHWHTSAPHTSQTAPSAVTALSGCQFSTTDRSRLACVGSPFPRCFVSLTRPD